MTAGTPTAAVARRDAGGLLAWLPVLLALVAEASWIAVIAGLLEAFVLHAPTLGVPELFLAALGGLVAARYLGPRLGDRWALVAVGLAAMCGLLGWLSSAEVRAILRESGLAGLGDALAANPGGWLAWVAFVRGLAYARLPLDPRRIGTLIAVGIPGLALAAIAGGMITEPWRTTFLATAQVQVVLFLATAIPALALSRLALVARGSSVDWRRNPAWLAMIALLVAGTAAIAIWVSASAGQAVATSISALVAPLLLIGFAVGFDRRSLRILLVSLGAAIAIGTILGAIGPQLATTSPAPPPVQAVTDAQQSATPVALGILALVLIAAVAAVLVLARLWLNRKSTPEPDDDEVRVIDRRVEREAAYPARRRSRFRRRAAPGDAVAAYRALLRDLDGRPPVARAPGETPAEHASRLRADGAGGLSLDLLAADYALVQFGGIRLTDRENERGLVRAIALRRSLSAVAAAQGAAAHGAAASTGATATGVKGPDGPVVRGRGRSQGPGADLPDADQPGVAASILTRIRRGP